MSDDTNFPAPNFPAPNFPAIEERLQAEARELLTAQRCVSAVQLAGVYRRRQRVRRAAQAAGAATALLLAALAIRFSGSRAETAHAPLVPQRAIVAQLKGSQAAHGQHAPEVPVPPVGFAQADQPDGAIFAIPFLIGDPAAGEEVITGIYVPEQVEPVDLRNLPPAERDAVRAVLGIEGEDTEVIQAI
ncbi:MAG TPA: hypothetical protein VG125_17560 [Pirellulales bacterium]|jgi:hypothetical protein|nr:hypothetical protein [Pirellulales bacterium]